LVIKKKSVTTLGNMNVKQQMSISIHLVTLTCSLHVSVYIEAILRHVSTKIIH